MIRTQIYLPRELFHEIEITAKREKKTKAQVVREALETGIEKKKSKLNAGAALLELAKLGEKLNVKGPTNLSTNHDSYYEQI